MKGTKIKYLIILALAVFDLVALFILFLATKNIIPVLIVAILLLCIQYPIMKQQISSEKYYRTIIEKEDQHLGNELLIKMFEMREAVQQLSKPDKNCLCPYKKRFFLYPAL